jgi:hypothetical protein
VGAAGARSSHLEVGGVDLHLVEAGVRPALVVLHG